MKTIPQKKCRECGKVKDASTEFFISSKTRGKVYFKPDCRQCQTAERERFKSAGTCVRCRVAPSKEGLTLCAQCHADTRANYHRSIRNRLARGKCGSCGVVHSSGHHNCKLCRAKYKGVRDRQIADGLCVVCKGKRGVNGSKHCCLACNKKRAAENASLRMQVITAYGACCKCCGESEPLFLNIDHVNNNGAEERRAGKSRGISFYRRIVQTGFPDTYQLLCFNCNCTRGFLGECPHVSRRRL